jgi:hypothetical protein
MNSATVEKFRGEATNAGRRAIAFVDSNREVAAHGLESIAKAVHRQADWMKRVATKGHQAGDTLEDAAAYVRERPVDRVLDDIARTIRSYPITAVLLGGTVGLLVGWRLTRRRTTWI